MGFRAVCIILLCGLIRRFVQSQCSLITPSVLRIDSEETIIVDGHGSTFNAYVMVQDFPRKSYNLVDGNVFVNKENGFLGTVKLTIPSKQLQRTPNKKQFVYVIVRSASCKLEKAVLVSYRSGYIFIQTDKPVYTPGSRVLYRILQMDQNMNPEKKAVDYEILTPQRMVVKKDSAQSESRNGFISLTYVLSDLASLGVWTISAKYKGEDGQNYETHFEVKEYVLPTFEIKLVKTQNYFYLNDKEIKVKIFANYLYGKPVNGHAFVLFGVKRDDKKKSLTDSLKRIPIRQGEGTATLERNILVKYFQKEEDMLEWRLCVTVTVITDTGSDMLEAELDDIYIVTSPYKILFTKTSRYFKPSMPFHYMVFVINPDGSPAQGVPVTAEPGESGGTTQADGTVRLVVNAYSDRSQMSIKVKTNHPKLTSDQQASAEMIAHAYESDGGNYLHVVIEGGVLKPGDNPTVSFNFKTKDTNVDTQITHFTYVILNKGRIMKVGRQPRLQKQPVVNMKLPITSDFIPSFRFVAYYTIKTNASREIVSDSIWVDVTDSCMGTLELTPKKDKDKLIQTPTAKVNLKLRADHNASVGLVAVDKAVYVLNSKFKISQSKVWESVEKYDIGCTPGGGINNVGVFHDAGLVLHTNFQLTTPEKQEPLCPQKSNRRRRSSAALIQYKDSTANKYTGLERTCCHDGMRVNPMGHSCERRSRLIQAGQNCVAAFLDCCKEFEKKRASERELHEDDELARADEDITYMDETHIVIRSAFPESWFWKIETMTEAPENGISSKTLNLTLKDSITTWEVLAVSLSANKGICVSEPYNIQVMMNFFIDLKLPYSVVRNEQVEIRAILYNYGNTKQKVRVEWSYNEAFCSLSTAKKKFREEVYIEAESSVALPFVIVPLIVGEHIVEVKAVGQFISDGVSKKLKVVPEGRRVVDNLITAILQPEARKEKKQEEVIPAVNITKIVPNSHMDTILTLQGTPISELVGKSIDGINVNHLIAAPSGCAEQNMMRMTTTVIATHYLDASGQWDRVGVDRREKALEYIKHGVEGQMAYRNLDASYGSFSYRPPGTWLTAYVVKVFALASKVIDIDRDKLCSSVKWLMTEKQQSNGLFLEDAPVYHQEMVGGITTGANELESTLTAFVLIAMLESNELCNKLIGDSLRRSMEDAEKFISEKYQTLQKPYSIAITSYALARAGKLQDTTKLMSACTGKNHWEEPESHHLSLEATSYALLTLLTLKQLQQAGPVAQWLTEQRFRGHVFGATQATIMLFQALSQYQLDVPAEKDLSMDVVFRMPGRSNDKKIRINNGNALLTQSDETKNNGEFTVTAEGPGIGTLTVFSVYYAIETEKEMKCNNFKLSVTIRDEPAAKKPEGAKSTVSIEICTMFLGTSDATMSILEISMMTGYAPSINDLKELQNRVDRYISSYEVKDEAFDRGTLILYLDKVSHTEEECIKFNLHQYFRVGLIQPASVTVYDYYSPEKRCTKFYYVDEDSKLLGKICYGEVCRCAEQNCFMQQQLGNVTTKERLDAACAASVDYVYSATLSKIEDRGNYDVYTMTINAVIKEGTDVVVNGDSRTFISHEKCRQALQLKVGQDYLTWGVSKDLWHVDSKYTYMLTRDTWIEWKPTEKECRTPANKKLCEELYDFTDELEYHGCLN